MRILVGMGSCGLAAGAGVVYEELEKIVGADALGRPPSDTHATANIKPIKILPTGCLGPCYLEPIVTVQDNNKFYDFVKVDSSGAQEILNAVANDNLENLQSSYLISDADKQTLNKYPRIALINCGRINPENIDDYIALGGYGDYKNLDIIQELKTSALRGRGGAGFPTHFKWQALKDAKGENKVVICNADEGDPGAFMDRSILEGDPHSVLEGMLLACLACGADEGIIYVRAEYPLAIKRLEIALSQANKRGLLKGKSIRIKAGAGAFVCGEETALIASLEGERGMPRLKPPFHTQKGYFGMPSLINNVETFANVVWIAKNGGAAFSNIGGVNSKGNKVFALAGKSKRGGLIEVPMGVSLKDCIFSMGGGIKDDKDFKAVQLGGPSGGCIPASLLDTKIDYAELNATGAIMGSGGMVVMDSGTCMVDMARFFLDFTVKESCGKCVSCRVGTKRMLEILERIVAGKGEDGDIEKLEKLSSYIKDGALCGLGQTAPNPVLTAIKYFKDEFTGHICDKKCAAKSCASLKRFVILKDKCIGCTVCALKCPTKAISGERKSVHVVDDSKCTKCGVCKSVCKFKAVEVE